MESQPGTPEVTVVLPTHNRADLVGEVVASALGQREVAVEVIVVDDASDDDTARRLSAIGDPRLRVLRNETNLGVSGARNRGIEAARGLWIAFLDDDDLWAPNKLRTQLDAAGGVAAALVYTAALAVDEHRRVRRTLPAPDDQTIRAELLGGNRIGSPSCAMVRADALRRVGGFDPELSILADWDLWLRLLAIGPAAACPEPLVAYTEHEENMHLAVGAMLREYFAIRRKHVRLGTAGAAGLGDRLWWQWIASGYRRKGRRLLAAGGYFFCAVRYRSRRDLRFAAAMLLGERLVPVGPDWPSPPAPAQPDWLASHQAGSQRRSSSAAGG
ncbi:MAG: glycosyltransferase family A protein [Solirubrobacteraceae bacterium]